jgi:hypothetical protein
MHPGAESTEESLRGVAIHNGLGYLEGIITDPGHATPSSYVFCLAIFQNTKAGNAAKRRHSDVVVVDHAGGMEGPDQLVVRVHFEAFHDVVVSNALVGMARRARLDVDYSRGMTMTKVSTDIDGTETVELNISYELIGGGAGRPWIITPGGRFSKDYPGVRKLAQTLADLGNRVIIWDRPNTGESDVCFVGRTSPPCKPTSSPGWSPTWV